MTPELAFVVWGLVMAIGFADDIWHVLTAPKIETRAERLIDGERFGETSVLGAHDEGRALRGPLVQKEIA